MNPPKILFDPLFLMRKIKNYIKAVLLYVQIPLAFSNGEKNRILKRIRLLLL